MTEAALDKSPVVPSRPFAVSLRELAKVSLALLAGAAALFAGAAFRQPSDPALPWWQAGLPYATALVCIVLGHVGAHILAASRVQAGMRFPWFVPSLSIGISGFVDSLPSSLTSARARLAVGLAGPAASAAIATVCLVIGLADSPVVTVDPNEAVIRFGEPLLFTLVSGFIVGPVQPGQDILLSPVAFAGWIGLLWSAIHLLPVEPFDGGYLVRSLYPGRSRLISILALFAMFALGVVVGGPWLVLAILLGIGLLVQHRFPAAYAFLFWRLPSSDTLSVDRDLETKDVIITTAVAVVLFLLCFTPVPVRM